MWLLVPDGLVWAFQKLKAEKCQLGFSCTTISGLTENSLKERKYSVSSSFLGGKAILMPEVRGKWPDCFELVGKQQLLRLLQPRYEEAHNKWNLEAGRLQQQKTAPGPLLSAKNRKPRLQFSLNGQEKLKNLAWYNES